MEPRTRAAFRSALITGATGFLGGKLAHRLADSGVAVTVIVRDSSNVDRIATLPGTIESLAAEGDGGELIEIFEQAAPDVIFHLAARYVSTHTHRDIVGVITDNVTLTAQICEAAAAAGCLALIAAGTAWQNANSSPGDPKPSPNTLYAASKQAADDIIDYYTYQAGLNAMTLKIYDSYGPDDPRQKFLTVLRDAAESNQTIDASPGDQLLHMVHVDDLVDGFIHAGNLLTTGKIRGRTSHTLPSPRPLKLRTIANLWMEANGKNVSINWGAHSYRKGEVLIPWTGIPLPGWSPRVEIMTGLKI